MRFYICSICDNVIEMVRDSGNTPSCCNRQMRELRVASTDGATEKHVPVCKVCENENHEGFGKITVRVGETDHPMTKEHHIEWIAVETSKGAYRKELAVDAEPCTSFVLGKDEKILGVYAYCNLHGLWKAEC